MPPASPATLSPARPPARRPTPGASAREAAPEGFEIVDNPARLFDPEATLIMRAIRPPALTHGLDIWTTRVLEKPIHDLVWTSARGVHAAFRRAAKSDRDFDLARHLAASNLYALGTDTAATLRGLGLSPRLVAADPAGLVRRLPAADLRKQRVALQLDAADASADRRDGHPVTAFLRSVRARTYAVSVGTPQSASVRGSATSPHPSAERAAPARTGEAWGV